MRDIYEAPAYGRKWYSVHPDLGVLSTGHSRLGARRGALRHAHRIAYALRGEFGEDPYRAIAHLLLDNAIRAFYTNRPSKVCKDRVANVHYCLGLFDVFYGMDDVDIDWSILMSERNRLIASDDSAEFHLWWALENVTRKEVANRHSLN
jgi:hypothetical protein